MARNDPHTQLSDAQKKVLEEHYYRAGVASVDELPYTEAMEELTRNFLRDTGLTLSDHEVWKAVKNLGRQGRLARRPEDQSPSDSCENEEHEAPEAEPPAGSGT